MECSEERWAKSRVSGVGEWSGACGYHRYLTKLYVGSALVSVMYGQSSELGLYFWGNWPLPTVHGLPLSMDGGCAPARWVSPIDRSGAL